MEFSWHSWVKKTAWLRTTSKWIIGKDRKLDEDEDISDSERPSALNMVVLCAKSKLPFVSGMLELLLTAPPTEIWMYDLHSQFPAKPARSDMNHMNHYESSCLRCGQTVYQVDKIGPLKDFTFFHQQCFKCSVCGTKLTLRTYFNSQQNHDDKEVYCSSHVPKSGPGHLDGHSVGIRAALNVPKTSNLVNEQIRGSGRGTFDAESLGIKQYIRSPKPNETPPPDSRMNDGLQAQYVHANATNNSYAGKFDASALHIRHALQATELQRKYQARDRNINEFLVRANATSRVHYFNVYRLAFQLRNV